MTTPQFKRGMHGYATLLRAIIVQPQTTDELAQTHGVRRASVANLMRRLHRQELVHISAWTQPRDHAHQQPIWSFGPGADAPVPPNCDGKRRVRVPVYAPAPMKVEAFTFGLIVAALVDGHTISSLCELLGLHRRGADILIGHMRAIRLVHISEWHKVGQGMPVAVYRIGDRRDRERPRPMSDSEINRGYRIRRAERDRYSQMRDCIAAPLPAHA